MLAEKNDEEAILGPSGLVWCCVDMFCSCAAENQLGVLMIVVLVDFGVVGGMLPVDVGLCVDVVTRPV